jgi:PAS domain S-box-containing protein
MKARFTVANKLILGFGILIFASVLNGLLIYSTLNTNQQLNKKVISVYNPSLSNLQELYSLINNSQMLVKNWVYIEKQPDTPDKQKLYDLHEFEFPQLKEKINEISKNWEPAQCQKIDTILTTISDTLFVHHKKIMDNLNSFSSYDDLMVLFEITPMVEAGGEVITTTNNVLTQIDELTGVISKKSNSANEEMAESFQWFQKFVIIAMIILSIIVVLVGFITTRSIVLPIYKVKEFLLAMTKGILPKEKLQTNNDEIGDMGDALNEYIENMHETSGFAAEIGKGNYNKELEALSDEDVLRNALIEMRENLRKAEEENRERNEADKIRNWITKGLADFGDTLRKNSDNMDELAKNVMTNLIEYLDVNQGSMYILNEMDETKPFFEMKTAIAYNREKYLKRNFELKEGLVGRCAFERLPVYLKEVPQDYINIKSGLGGAEPNYLLLVPLIFNENVLGVIEVASFNEIKKYQIEFVSTLGENIASTISNVRINEQTKHLLEESKLRGDELSAQEEELRQNMEELQATQEEAARRENEMANTIEAINNTMGTIEIDKTGNITSINDSLLNKLQGSAGNFVGKSFQELFAASNILEDEFIGIWANLQVGESGTLITNYITTEKELWFRHTFTPFRDQSGQLRKAIDLVIDITEQKQLEKELESAKLNLG